MKRGAQRQITKDDAEEKEEEATEGSWKEASAEKLAGRKIIKVKRKENPATGEDASVPAFQFGAPKAEAAGAFNFDFGATAKKPEEKKEETKAAPVVNAFAALIDTTEWECASCGVRNKQSASKCAACEEPKAGTKPAAGAAAPAAAGVFGAGGFSFGGASGITFGAPAAATDATPAPGGFTFGGEAAGVTFGSVGSSGVTFGSSEPTKFEASSSFGAATEDPTKEQFKDKKPEASGTEKDNTIHKVPQCKVFQLKNVEGKNKFVECGEGELQVNTVKTAGGTISRVVLRAEKTHRLVLNATLPKGVKVTMQGEKFVKFASNDLENKSGVFLLKAKNKAESALLISKMEEAATQSS